ncbi:hypothetical protein CFREI_02235 [Corynebacterium freiburgense]|nr:hypothetical protein CFREI_02235 [Corynebacterium freiburgense]
MTQKGQLFKKPLHFVSPAPATSRNNAPHTSGAPNVIQNMGLQCPAHTATFKGGTTLKGGAPLKGVDNIKFHFLEVLNVRVTAFCHGTA